MATRSTIWVQNEDGIMRGVYCHNDGSLVHNGAILLNDYGTIEKANELINNGGISTLSYFIGDKCNFDYSLRTERESKNCCFYHRDRVEALEIFEASNIEECDSFFEEYNYFLINGVWHYNKDGEKLEVLTNEAILSDWNGIGYIDPFFAQKVLKDLLFKEV